MDAWVIWLIVAVVLAVGEIATTSFFLAPFAGGAAAAALLAAAGAGTTVEAAAFLVVSLILLAALRPVARTHRLSKAVKTGTAALVGQSAIVMERISNDEGVGCIKLDGEIWTARAFDDEMVIEPGTKVHVLEIRGATALVSE
ncbi:NfeD family protein [Solirubrobacter phytolaccae]|uniref:NfeD family protein n=1 Tax=Solirubrobacter phytolaccae TaxID=1404360 RepID=A0A9X3NG55_9ACTN|nr:NfeD family protein [Solirubrobacter phytolaccae]MDA0185506.1 NfeD family protein [Solirubrobacter phytolaccae]